MDLIQMALNNGQHKYSTVYGRQIDLDPEKRKEWIQRERERERGREREGEREREQERELSTGK